MAKTVFALYDRFEQAFDVVQALSKQGVDREKISLIFKDPYGQKAQELGIGGVGTGEESHTEEIEPYPDGDSHGVSMDAVLRQLDNTAAATLPAIGPVIAAGPIAVMLGGGKDMPGGSSLTGGETVGWVDALRDLGVTGDDAQAIHDGIRRGNILVMVDRLDRESEPAVEILNRYQPIDLHAPAAQKAAGEWRGFNEGAEPFAFDAPPHPFKERAPGSSLDLGMGADEYLPGRAIGQYNKEATDSSHYIGDDPDAWRQFEPRFRDHFQQHYAASGRRWDDYRDAYHFGYDLARLNHAINKDWETLRGYAEQNWASRNMGKHWPEYEDAVRAGWETARERR